MKRRAADLDNSMVIDTLTETIWAKLEKRFAQQLTLNQQVQSSSLWRLTTKPTTAADFSLYVL